LLSRTRQIAAEDRGLPAGLSPDHPRRTHAGSPPDGLRQSGLGPRHADRDRLALVARDPVRDDAARTGGLYLPASETKAAKRLTALVVAVTRLPNPLTVSAGHYRVLSIKEGAKADVRGDNAGAGQIVTGEFAVEVATTTMPAGSFVVRLDQPLAHLAAAIMKPESPVAYVANRVIAIPESKILPIWRLMSLAALP
jgi:hypothetical protein